MGDEGGGVRGVVAVDGRGIVERLGEKGGCYGSERWGEGGEGGEEGGGEGGLRGRVFEGQVSDACSWCGREVVERD